MNELIKRKFPPVHLIRLGNAEAVPKPASPSRESSPKANAFTVNLDKVEAPTMAMSSPLGGGGTEQSDVTEEAFTNASVCKEFSSAANSPPQLFLRKDGRNGDTEKAPAGNGLQRYGDRYVCANTPKVAKPDFAKGLNNRKITNYPDRGCSGDQ